MVEGGLNGVVALVEALVCASGQTLVVTLVIVADLLMKVEESLSAGDTFGQVGDVGTVDLLDGLGDAEAVGLGHGLSVIVDSRHVGCKRWRSDMVRQ